MYMPSLLTIWPSILPYNIEINTFLDSKISCHTSYIVQGLVWYVWIVLPLILNELSNRPGNMPYTISVMFGQAECCSTQSIKTQMTCVSYRLSVVGVNRFGFWPLGPDFELRRYDTICNAHILLNIIKFHKPFIE